MAISLGWCIGAGRMSCGSLSGYMLGRSSVCVCVSLGDGWVEAYWFGWGWWVVGMLGSFSFNREVWQFWHKTLSFLQWNRGMKFWKFFKISY